MLRFSVLSVSCVVESLLPSDGLQQFFRAFCPNDPGTRRDAGERFAAVVKSIEVLVTGGCGHADTTAQQPAATAAGDMLCVPAARGYLRARDTETKRSPVE
jgi:hypothetical protein